MFDFIRVSTRYYCAWVFRNSNRTQEDFYILDLYRIFRFNLNNTSTRPIDNNYSVVIVNNIIILLYSSVVDSRSKTQILYIHLMNGFLVPLCQCYTQLLSRWLLNDILFCICITHGLKSLGPNT